MRARTAVALATGAIALAVVAYRASAPAPGWSQEMRDAFLRSCATSNRTAKPADLKHYCECTLARLETGMTVAEYRREEARMTAGDYVPTERMAGIIFGCLGADPGAAAADPALPWSAEEQRRFLVGCVPAARASLGADAEAGPKAARYCRCAVAEAARRMPPDDYRELERAAGGTTPASGPLRDIATACAAAL